ncbi:Nucleolar complex protein 3-like [Homarus americanus]|uniref:NOC3-like protein n=1 Tax=Homarus americanus TaxID=6706 RepID=A0A8J5MTJ5_HOMAM|nr:Nucleolar complex protein 3-like [Homarus americanus]
MAKRVSRLKNKGKKKGLSAAKISNIQKYKQAKKGILTPAQKKKKDEDKKARKHEAFCKIQKDRKKFRELQAIYATDEEAYPLTAEITGEEMMNMMDPDDLTYLIETEGKKKKYQDLLAAEEAKEAATIAHENEDRSFDKNPLASNMRSLLPIKTDQGIIPRYMEIKEETEEGDEDDQQPPPPTDEELKKQQTKDERDKKKSTLEFLLERHRKLELMKVKIGCLSASFIEEPQERISALSSILHCMKGLDPDIAITIKKYAALSLLEVFHYIIPSYSIHHNDTDQKLKKETRRLYFYENQMLSAYQAYLKSLEEMLLKEERKKRKNPALKQMAMVALKCLGELLMKHSHFNYTGNLIQALVPYLNHSDDDFFSQATSYFTRLFKDDREGRISLEVVQRIDQFVRRRTFRVQPQVLRVLLGLRIKNVQSLDAELEAELTAKRKLTHKEKLLKKLTEKNKQKKSNKEAKRYRKKRKLEEQVKEIKKEKSKKVRNTYHTSIIQLVFGLFIHVLKRRPNQKLMGIVLEGLAKFAHLINIEFFADLLNCMSEIMAEGTLKFRESLHCIQVVCTILSGQGEVLTLDPHRFYKYLYVNMFNLSLGLNHNDILSAVESLKQMLVERRKRVSAVRVQAFAKRLATLSLTLLHSGTIASLATLRSIILHHPSTEALLETDTEGTSGLFSAEIEEPEHSNAAASCFWELHYLTVSLEEPTLPQNCPADVDPHIARGPSPRPADELFGMYDPSEMRFNPTIPNPSQHLSGKVNKTKKLTKRHKGEQWMTHYMTQETQDLLTVGLLSEDPVTVNGSLSNNINGHSEENDQSSMAKSPSITNLTTANFFTGMFSNMDVEKIPSQIMTESQYGEDFTLSLLKVASKT